MEYEMNEIKYYFLSNIPSFTHTHVHVHTHMHTCAHAYTVIIGPYCRPARYLPVSTRTELSRAPASDAGWVKMLWDACQWPEQSSLKSLEALPSLRQESHQWWRAGFYSVSTGHGLWAWNEWWGNDMKQLIDRALALLPGWPRQSVLQNPPLDGRSASGRDDEWGWSEWHTNDMD